MRGRTVSVALPPSLPTGAVSVGYRVVSEDSHPVSGTVRFTYAGAPTSTSGASSGPATGPSPASAGATAQSDGAPAHDHGRFPTAWLIAVVPAVVLVGLLVVLLRRSRQE